MDFQLLRVTINDNSQIFDESRRMEWNYQWFGKPVDTIQTASINVS